MNTDKAIQEEYDNKPSPPVIKIDYAVYEQYLVDSDLTEEEKRAFLDTLWNIIVTFVDLGFGVHPLQQACEEPLELDQLTPSQILASNDHPELNPVTFEDQSAKDVKKGAES